MQVGERSGKRENLLLIQSGHILWSNYIIRASKNCLGIKRKTVNNLPRTSIPDWLKVSNQFLLPIIEHAAASVEERKDIDPTDRLAPLLAAIHLHQSIRASMSSNSAGHHSIAIALLRQCVEALTVVEIGLQSPELVKTLLEIWRKDKSHGTLRKRLQTDRWSSYGPGLWAEPWEEYFGNLAFAVQPYAHYTELLMGWQYVLPPVAKKEDGIDPTYLYATYGFDKVDSLKLIRIQIFQALIGWTLARVLEENSITCPMSGSRLATWGSMLRVSELFDDPNTNWREHWRDQLLPFLWFTTDDWRP